MWDIEQKATNEKKGNKKKLINIDNSVVVTKGKGSGEKIKKVK